MKTERKFKWIKSEGHKRPNQSEAENAAEKEKEHKSVINVGPEKKE